MTTKEIFAIRLKTLREEHNLSTRDLESALKCDHSSITHYEKLNREPNKSFLKKVSDYFNVSSDYLIGRTEQK